MNTKLFANNKLINSRLLNFECKRLEQPSTEGELKIIISIGMELGEAFTDETFDVKFTIKIECIEEEDPKLFVLNYSRKAFYKTTNGIIFKENNFEKDLKLFIRESYSLSYKYINDILREMQVKFNLPHSIPENSTEKL